MVIQKMNYDFFMLKVNHEQTKSEEEYSTRPLEGTFWVAVSLWQGQGPCEESLGLLFLFIVNRQKSSKWVSGLDLDQMVETN